MVRGVLVVLLAMGAGVSGCGRAAAAGSAAAGFERTSEPDGTEVGIWYPSAGRAVRERIGLAEQEVVPDGSPAEGGLPLVVMSHGSGGSFAGHADTAVALARNGFVVAALTHPGDNWRDGSRATRVEERPVALRALIDFMLNRWRFRGVVDPGKVGAFGFSAGGFTVLAAAGGRPELSRMAEHCAAHPASYDCALLRAQPRPAAAPWRETRDGRIRALVVAAPALGFSFAPDGLAAVTVPVQLWRAGNDRVLPAPEYADAVRAALPRPPEFRDVPGAGHFDFLAPCAAPVPPSAAAICTGAPGFDRPAFHRMFDAAVAGFFRRTLGTG